MSDFRLKEIHLSNVKVHRDVHLLDLPKDGLILLSGENSAGKSAIMDFMIDALSGNFRLSEDRLKYISYGESSTYAKFVSHDNMVIEVNLYEEASMSFYTFTYPDGKKVTSSVSDRVTKIYLASIVGWHQSELDSLNFHKTAESGLLFLNRTPKESCTILKESMTDSRVELAISTLEAYEKELKVESVSIKNQILGLKVVANREVEPLENITNCLNDVDSAYEYAKLVDMDIQVVKPLDTVSTARTYQKNDNLLKTAGTITVENVLNESELVELTSTDTIDFDSIETYESLIKFPIKGESSINFDSVQNKQVVQALQILVNRADSVLEESIGTAPLEVNEYNSALSEYIALNGGSCPTCGRELA